MIYYEVIIDLGVWGTISFDAPDFLSAYLMADKKTNGLDGAHVEIKFKKSMGKEENE